jgi:hypothetical protein
MTSNQPWWLTWPVAEVAAAILPLFSQRVYQQETISRYSVVNWCETGSYEPRSVNGPLDDPDHRAVTEAMQMLEHASLLVRVGESSIGLTRLGTHALQTNTVRQYLGLSDFPPTI